VSIVVVRPGVHTTVQDLGRFGFASHGIPESGALDPVSHRLANMLVGNRADAATLELTLDGPHLRFERASLIAVCGADMSPTLDGAPLAQWRPVRVAANSSLRFGGARTGARAYLAVAGGIDVPPVLGSRSTNSVIAYGGHCGRRLRAGDLLALGAASSAIDAVDVHWSIGAVKWMPTNNAATLRLVPAERHAELAQAAIAHGAFTLSIASDRMGIRLVESIAGGGAADMISEPMLTGAVQLPPDGRPMILMNDHQTTGGYPIIGHVATVDLPSVAQLTSGGRVRFEAIDVAASQRLLFERERELARMERWIRMQPIQ
jgi:antagonist of KipI